MYEPAENPASVLAISLKGAMSSEARTSIWYHQGRGEGVIVTDDEVGLH